MARRVNPGCCKRPPLNAHQATVGWALRLPAQSWQAERLPYNSNSDALARSEREMNFRTRYTIDASTSTIPVTTNSRAVACARIQMIAIIASAGTIFIPGKLNPDSSGSERTSCCTKIQQAAQQRKYISKTATFESTASCSKVPLSDSANASVA